MDIKSNIEFLEDAINRLGDLLGVEVEKTFLVERINPLEEIPEKDSSLDVLYFISRYSDNSLFIVARGDNNLLALLREEIENPNTQNPDLIAYRKAGKLFICPAYPPNQYETLTSLSVDRIKLFASEIMTNVWKH